jgi:ribosomal-protein-alanine N-acetyltransferase
MSARLQPHMALRPLRSGELDAVMAIENRAYEFPWSRENFFSSWASAYWMQGLHLQDTHARGDALVAYLVAMQGVEEMHLLNLTVAPEHQGRGLGCTLLEALRAHAQARGCAQIWLEVRVGNARALRLYRRFGFEDVHVRKGYYPAGPGGREREDAQVMRLRLDTAHRDAASNGARA